MAIIIPLGAALVSARLTLLARSLVVTLFAFVCFTAVHHVLNCSTLPWNERFQGFPEDAMEGPQQGCWKTAPRDPVWQGWKVAIRLLLCPYQRVEEGS